MSLKIYHNPRCSQSRQTLELIRNAGIEPEIVRYLDDTPSPETIVGLAESLGVRVADLLRRKESEFRTADDLPDLDDKAIGALPRDLQHGIYKGFIAPAVLYAALGVTMLRNRRGGKEGSDD